MRHFAANHILLLRRVMLIGILHCCEAHKGCSGTLPLQFQTAPQAAFTFCRSAQCGYSIRLLRQNISRPERHGILSLIAHCRAAQDISRWLLFCSCGVYRGAAARCPRKNIASAARVHTFAYRSLRPCAGHHLISIPNFFATASILRISERSMPVMQRKSLISGLRVSTTAR